MRASSASGASFITDLVQLTLLALAMTPWSALPPSHPFSSSGRSQLDNNFKSAHGVDVRHCDDLELTDDTNKQDEKEYRTDCIEIPNDAVAVTSAHERYHISCASIARRVRDHSLRRDCHGDIASSTAGSGSV